MRRVGDACGLNTRSAEGVLQLSIHLLRNPPLGTRAWTTALAALLLAASSGSAQDLSRPLLSDFSRLREQLKAGDEVVVNTRDGTTIRGRVVEVSTVQIAVVANNVRREIPSDQVTRVQRRRNGILLGALIGAGAGVPFGLALKSYAHNEGSTETGALLFPIGVGLGVGIAIDAFLVVPRTVFERAASTRAQLLLVVGPGRAVAQITIGR